MTGGEKGSTSGFHLLGPSFTIPAQQLLNGSYLPRLSVYISHSTASFGQNSLVDLLTKFLSQRLVVSGFVTKSASFFQDAYQRGLSGNLTFDATPNVAGSFVPNEIESVPGLQYGRVKDTFLSDFDVSINTELLQARTDNIKGVLNSFMQRVQNNNIGTKQNLSLANVTSASNQVVLDAFSNVADHEFGWHGSYPGFNHQTFYNAGDFSSDLVYAGTEYDQYNSGAYYVSGFGIFKNGVGSSSNFANAYFQDYGKVAELSPGGIKELGFVPLIDVDQAEEVKQEIASDSDAFLTEFAGLFGSTLGRLIGGSNLIIGTAAGSVLSAAALSIGKAIFNGTFVRSPGAIGTAASQGGTIWTDFQNNLGQFGVNAAIGSTTSYLAAEFAQSIGLTGVGGQLFSVVGGDVLQYVATKALAGTAIGNLLGISAPTSLGGTVITSVAAFVGTQLASLVVTPHTVAQAALASLGSAVGAYAGTYIGTGIAVSALLQGNLTLALAAIPGGIVIGAFIGFILGDLIGSLFGHHKPRVPTAMAETVLQIPYARYGLGSETSANGGDLAFADAMAKAARDTLNGIIAQITRSSTPSFVSNTVSPTQTYGYSGSQIYVKLGVGASATNVTSADQAVDKGVLWALPQTQIIGGDIILKRAIANAQDPTVTALLGDLQIASDYETYLKAEPVIDAAIASSWNSLSAADQAFYTAHQAFMTRAISATELPLTGSATDVNTDLGYYTANKTQVDRIVGSISVSSFAAGWITTLARAAELKLGQFGPSDFNGGLQGFLQSFGVASTGSAVHYEDASVTMANGALTVSLAGVAAPGTFSLLPQAATGDGHAVTIANFNSVMGYTGSTGAITNGNDLIISVTPITLANSSFEQPAYAAGVSGGGASSWNTAGSVGTWNPNGLITPTDGSNIAYLDGSGGNAAISQQAGTFVAGNTYTFTVDVGGRRDGSTNLGTVNVQISSGTATKAVYQFRPTAPLGTMQTASVSYTATAADAGQALFVYVSETGAPWQVSLDNARLTAASSSSMTVSAGSPAVYSPPYVNIPATNGGSDIVVGGNANDALNAGAGDAWINGGAGDDQIVGGAGHDVLIGDVGNDSITAGTGGTYLAGGTGNDTLIGGAANDVLVGGAGLDRMFGNNGDDTFIVDPDGGATWDYMDGGAGSDAVSFERLTSGVSIDMRANLPSNPSPTLAGTLQAGQSVYSPDGHYLLAYQADGNLVLYIAGGASIWASNTNGTSAGRVVMQSDGNLVIYNAANQPV